LGIFFFECESESESVKTQLLIIGNAIIACCLHFQIFKFSNSQIFFRIVFDLVYTNPLFICHNPMLVKNVIPAGIRNRNYE